MAKVSTNLGKVATTPKGEYSNETTYIRLDIVSYNGSSYVCLKESVGILPTNTEYWQLIASKGDTGAKGQNGQDGYTPVKGVDYFTQEDIASLNIPSKTSDITNDSGFITNSVNNLINYYLKNEVYTKNEVAQLIGAIQQFHYEVVQELPQTGANNIMYLVPKSTSQTNNVYDEYVYSNGWEKIGDTEIDLSNYVTITMLNQALADYTTTANLTTLLTQKQDLLTAGENISIDNNVISASENNILYFDMSTARYKPEFTRNTTELLHVASANSNKIAIDYSPMYFKICSKLDEGIKPLVNISFGNNSGFSAIKENNYLFYINNYTTDTIGGETIYRTIELTGINYVDDANFTNTRKVYLMLKSNVGTSVDALEMADKIMLPTDLSGKQDTLIAGDNITIQNNVISASGGGNKEFDIYYIDTDIYNNLNPFVFSQHKRGLYVLSQQSGSQIPQTFYMKGKTTDTTLLNTSMRIGDYLVYDKEITDDTTANQHIGYIMKRISLSNGSIVESFDRLYFESGRFKIYNNNSYFNYLTLNTAQSISAKKTFTVLPESSLTPTTANQLVNKKYVDDAIGGALGGSY